MEKNYQNHKRSRIKELFFKSTKEYAIFYALVLVFIVMSIIAESFFTVDNIIQIIRQAAVVGILAAGEFFVIISGMIDLSIGSTVAISGVVFAAIVKAGGMALLPVGIIAALCVGLIVGLVNGIIISRLYIPPFITTLGTMLIFRGLVHAVTSSYPIGDLPMGFEFIGRGYFLEIPVPVFILVGVFIIVKILAENRKMGRFMYAIGGNEDAANLSGINIKKYKTLALTLCGLMAGLGSVILTSRLTSGQPRAAQGYEFDAIIAVVIGGVSFSGGKGKPLSVLLGALFVTTLISGLRILNVDTNIQDITKGLVFILAIGLDVWRNRIKK